MRTCVTETNPDAMFMDGYDDAIVGVVSRFGMNDVTAYDVDKVIATLVKGGCTEEEAVEFFEFNQIGAWVGENTPAFVRFLKPE